MKKRQTKVNTMKKRQNEVPVKTEAQIRARIDSLLAEESTQPLRWWYVQFNDPISGAFNGANLVESRGHASALRKTHILGINPGGNFISSPMEEVEVPQEHREVLLNEDTVRKLFSDVPYGFEPCGCSKTHRLAS
jgi:hypothetical protein